MYTWRSEGNMWELVLSYVDSLNQTHYSLSHFNGSHLCVCICVCARTRVSWHMSKGQKRAFSVTHGSGSQTQVFRTDKSLPAEPPCQFWGLLFGQVFEMGCSQGWPKFLTLLSLPLKHWDYRHGPPCSACRNFFMPKKASECYVFGLFLIKSEKVRKQLREWLAEGIYVRGRKVGDTRRVWSMGSESRGMRPLCCKQKYKGSYRRRVKMCGLFPVST